MRILRRRTPDGPLSCAQVGRLLQQHLDGEANAPVAERIAEHLEACRRCGLEAETYTAIKASLSSRAQPLPADSLERLRSFSASLAAGDEPPDDAR